MKFLKYITIAAAALALSSCQEVDKTCALPADKVVAPVMDEHSDIIVDADNLSSEVTFTWSAVDYGYHAAVSYALFGVYGEVEYQLAESASTSYTFTKESLNNALVNSKGLGVPADDTSTVFFYVVSSVSTRSDDPYTKKSEPISLQITTIKSTSAPWIRRLLYVPGKYQEWSPSTAPVLWENGENSDVYEGPVYLMQADGAETCEFKFTGQPDWNPENFGGSLDALANNGDNLTAASGLYWIKVTLTSDHSTGSVKMTPITCIGVIGTAIGGWGDADDVEMTLAGLPTDPEDPDFAAKHIAAVNAQIWEAVCDDCAGGEFKFRLDHAWAQNWGGNLAHLNPGGDNINTALTGKVRFTIDFHGDIAALAEDATNPSPVSATVSKVE
ncbi:MAG: SusE domain-containing protein [Alistipes sp.]|nr:SusE domain-containing protein [Alistipes sp.]